MIASEITRDLVALYAQFSWWRQFYVRFRVALSRFEQIEALLPRNGRVLDLGCGYGVVANYLALAEPSREVIGLDLNARRIAVAQKTVGARANITFLADDVMRANLPPCDAAILTDVLHHLTFAQQEQLTSRVRGLLAPRGVLLIQEVNMQPCWKYWISHVSDVILYASDGMPNFRSSQDWVALLERNDFQNARVIPGDAGSIFARVSYVAYK